MAETGQVWNKDKVGSTELSQHGQADIKGEFGMKAEGRGLQEWNASPIPQKVYLSFSNSNFSPLHMSSEELRYAPRANRHCTSKSADLSHCHSATDLDAADLCQPQCSYNRLIRSLLVYQHCVSRHGPSSERIRVTNMSTR
ncbi:uncharacterized protein MEPE_02741 [Melanopsichium pennsylvanicum]|uniref:Uncharacterized protein n=1 Tax=Melanopsichium pennsylvanicum TaxID=63383 RepID=A0AAJ4XKZ4_9BASI|nr:uncharacterized protein MEPE_02741 [Melanopsichium pennsylvanicum]